jgi:hypothetical protein
VKRNPDQALKYLSIAEKLLVGDEVHWVLNHIAFAYQQKLFKEKERKELNEKLAMEYGEQVLEQYQPYENTRPNPHHLAFTINRIQLLAFGYCVKALTYYEVKQLDAAVINYQHALAIYEKHGLLDDQYARAKNRCAQFLVEQGNIAEARKMFQELDQYWLLPEKNRMYNPYAARFYVSYAGFLENHNPKLALAKYQIAYKILCVTDGKEAGFTKDIQAKIAKLDNQLYWRNAKFGVILSAGMGMAFLGCKALMTTNSQGSAPKVRIK